jgi:tetratricopeptide (TPR) repeat protein/ubiquinone/menaquinone biosynthesis C-methylase UbiE
MELTVDQALQQGVAAHKEGKFEEAERLYRAVLQSQPLHPDGNHNLGVLAVSVNNADAALPLFKTALEANPKIEQFWLSYIDALIKEQQFENAKQVFEQAKTQGVAGEKLNVLETQLPPTAQVNEPKLAVQKKSLPLSEKRKKLAEQKKQKKAKKQNLKTNNPSQRQLSNLLEYYQNGRFSDAEKLAVSITQEFSKHQFGWKVLGAVLKQTGRSVESLIPMQKSVRLAPQDAEAHNNLGITLQELGRLDEAEASYTQAIAAKPDYAEAHYNLGNTLKELGRLDEAEASYKQAIALKPDLAEARSNLGNTLKELGRLNEAEASLRQAVALKPDFAEAHYNLGNTLNELGRLDEALASYKQAIALKPDYAEAYNNLGNTLQELGRLEEAEASLRQAIAVKPDYAEAHNNLGNTLKELRRLDEAEASCRQAIALKPDFAEAHSNLSNTLHELGQLDEAVEACIKALQIKPDYTEAYYNLGLKLMGIGFRKPMPSLFELICKILAKKTLVRPSDISNAVISLLKFDPIIKGTITKHSSGELVQSLQEAIFGLSNVPLLLKFMAICPIPDFEFESLFKDIRSAVLLSISNIENNSEILGFQTALALHCFTNEYLYDQTDIETEALEKLENLVGNKLTTGKQPTPTELACLASYKALYEYSWIQLVTVPVELQELERRQIIEPEKEKQLRSNIPILQKINDNVSRKVQEQYEQNPYPRWVNTKLPLVPKPISLVTKEIDLNIKKSSVNEIKNPQILIAGCGTGQHSIRTATRFKNCDVLAIDLSLSSLSYAKRKTQELGISNIEYMQADILDLGALNRQFDIIESAGVLHHMDDPMVGWEVLTGCLKAGGLMKIGLYSELARSHIVQMRHEIQQSNIGSSNDVMKSFREMIVSSKEEHHNMVGLSSDFYSLSEFRDLLFHVQEHRFTIPKIKDCLAQLGLTFCGFEADKIIRKFKSKTISKNAVYDLDKWDAFEKENPSEFISMYQFWCQKTV